MDTTTDSKFNNQIKNLYKNKTGIPGLLVAYSECLLSEDRFVLQDTFLVGRTPDCQLAIEDNCLSKTHFVITKENDQWFIEDLGSKNGTRLNGIALDAKVKLQDDSVIVAAGTLFVFNSQTSIDVFNSPVENYGIMGKFHVERVIHSLMAAAKSSLPLLIVGPSGSGKELAARAYAFIVNQKSPNAPFVVVHAGRFATEEQAMTGLFGVKKGVFSGVDSQVGLVKSADGGVLFLDEIHRLFQSAQVGLLRVIENGDLSAIGEELKNIKSNARFVFASNSTSEFSGLVPDLFARLKKITLLPLSKRIADIPILFKLQMQTRFHDYRIPISAQQEMWDELSIDHFELLCLYGFKDNNVRGIINLCDEIITGYKQHEQSQNALNDAFFDLLRDMEIYQLRADERYKEMTKEAKAAAKRAERKREDTSARMTSKMYDQNKSLILNVYRNECACNYVNTMKTLNKDYGLKVTRVTLARKIRNWEQGS